VRPGRYAGHGRSATAEGTLKKLPLALVTFMVMRVVIRMVKTIAGVE